MGGPALHVSYLTKGLEERGYDTTLAAGTIGARRGLDVVRRRRARRRGAPDPAAAPRHLAVLRHAVGDERRAPDPPPAAAHPAHAHGEGGRDRPRRGARLAATRGRRSSCTPSTGTSCAATSTRRARRRSGRSSGGSRARRRGSSPSAPRCATTSSSSASRRPSASRVDPPRHPARQPRRPATGGPRASCATLFGVPPDRFVVGWIGRMTAIKRVEDVLLAFRDLRARGVDATLVPGRRRPRPRGPRAPRARARRSRGTCSRSATSATSRRTTRSWTRCCCRRRTRARRSSRSSRSRRGGRSWRRGSAACPDVVEDGEDGFLVPVGDVDAMAAALERLARDPELRAADGRARLARASSRATASSASSTTSTRSTASCSRTPGCPLPAARFGGLTSEAANRSNGQYRSRPADDK